MSPYDVEKVFLGSVLFPASEEEWLDLGTDLNEKFEVMEASLHLSWSKIPSTSPVGYGEYESEYYESFVVGEDDGLT